MDYMGILKQGWDVTRRNKRLWILGLLAGGGASLSSGSWNSGFLELGKLPGPACGVGERTHPYRGAAARA